MWEYNHTEELYHYGVLGMKWGVRRYQNADGTLTAKGKKRLQNFSSKFENEDYTLSKGTKFYRVGAKNEKDTEDRTYVTYKTKDAANYILDSGEGVQGAYKISLESKEMIKIAKGKSMVEAFCDTLGSTKISDIASGTMIKDYDSKGKETKYTKDSYKKNLKIYSNAFKNYKAFETAYRQFHKTMINNTDINSQYRERLKKKGYNAMFDVNDNGYTDSPLIIFNRLKTLQTKKISEITGIDQRLAEAVIDDDLGLSEKQIEKMVKQRW